MSSARLLSALLLLACRADPASDREVYLASLTAPPEDLRELCGSMGDPELRSECLALGVTRVAPSLDVAAVSRWCEEIEVPAWREECFFQVVEGAARWDEDAVEMCARAGSFAASCAEHLFFLRARLDPDLPDGVGEEEALRAALRPVAQQMVGSRRPAERARHSDEAVAKRLATRFGAGPFDVALCGAADRYTCGLAYVESLRDALRRTDRARMCAGPATSGRAVAEGYRGWTDASDELAGMVWRELCLPGGHGTGPRTTIRLDPGRFRQPPGAAADP